MPSQGIVHRDIKSENVFRTVSGAWKLGDFGSSLRIGDERLLNKQVVKLEGTFSFAAPEYISIWDEFTRPQLVQATTFKVGKGVDHKLRKTNWLKEGHYNMQGTHGLIGHGKLVSAHSLNQISSV